MADEAMLSDEEIFMSDSTPETPATEVKENTEAEPAPTETAPLPEEKGEAKADPDPKEDDAKPDGLVPSWRLREKAEEARAAQRELQEAQAARAQAEARLMAFQEQMAAMQAQQQRQPAPDRYQDPEAYEQYRDAQQAQFFQQVKVRQDKTEAYAIYGYDVVEKAMQAALEASNANPVLDRQIAQSPNPFKAAVEWHKQHQVLSQIGEGGLDGYKAKVRDELMRDPEIRKQILAEMRSQASVPPPQNSPMQRTPSINGAASAGMDRPGMDRPMTDEEIFYS